MPQNNETKTCPKCKGRGNLPHFATQHDNGTCTKCKGKGDLRFTSVEAHNTSVSEVVELELNRIQDQANTVKANFASSRRTNPAVLDKRLAPLRAAWKAVKTGEAGIAFREVTRGYWG